MIFSSIAAPCSAAITIDFSYVNQQSQQFTRYKAWVDRAVNGNPDYLFSATDAAYMYKLTGQSQYAQLAVQMVDEQVSDAESAIASGGQPDVAHDSYLHVGDMIGDLALTYDWCATFTTSSQRTRWTNYAEQTVFNVWNPNQAEWGGRSADWSGWAISDPANNYFYSFMQATMYWALADDSAPWDDFINTVKIPLLTTYFATIDGGSQEGTGYGLSHKNLFDLYRVWRDSTGIDLGLANPHVTDTIAWWIHATVPTLDRVAGVGDQARVSEPVIYDYHRTLILEARNITNDADAKANASWWLHNISVQQMTSGFNERFDLLPAGDTGTPPSSLTHYAAATGHLWSRTGWDTHAMWMEFDAGPYLQSHAHQDQGSFTLYQNSWLAVTENIWSHSGIQQGTNVNNILRFEQNGNVVGQRTNTISTMTYTAGDGGAVHAVANLTPAYGGSSAVQSWQRTIDFANGSMTVQDDYAVGSGTNATFQVNTPVRPVISGHTATAGGLTITVLSPANATLTAVDWTGVDDDFNSGWRLDIGGGSGQYIVELAGAPTGDILFNGDFD